ncbi:class I SAM-dependent methyltransferase [Arthrobacter halodurans]|uniref:S-adenosyl-L-methionine-dependent methyltransferase n=1 Tax=Arthrobacter halodurans TaxID=516699 RepID=A0ABV4UIH9_9MICC
MPQQRPRAAAFRLTQAALAPAAVLAYPYFVGKLLIRSRASGVSATAVSSLYARHMQHRLGTRPDETATRLLSALPGVSRGALCLVTLPTRAAHRITGHVPPVYRYPYTGTPPLTHHAAARTTYYDDAVAKHLDGARGLRQLVVLGAGFDTRAHRADRDSPVRFFEVDTPATQALKRGLLRRTGMDRPGVTYVPVDFLAQDWWQSLVAAGFEPAGPALFLWEAVTMYLDMRSVEGTLDRIASAAPGSVVAFDYFSADTLRSRGPFMRYARAAARFVGEPLAYGLETSAPAGRHMAAVLGGHGLVLAEHRPIGTGVPGGPPPAGFVIATVPDVAGTRNRIPDRRR